LKTWEFKNDRGKVGQKSKKFSKSLGIFHVREDLYFLPAIINTIIYPLSLFMRLTLYIWADHFVRHCFDIVGSAVLLPVNIVSEMTFYVSGGTMYSTHSLWGGMQLIRMYFVGKIFVCFLILMLGKDFVLSVKWQW